MTIINQVRNIIFPFICPICKKNPPDIGGEICESCHSKLVYVQSPFCKGCGGTVDGVLDVCRGCLNHPRPWKKVATIFEFTGLVRKIIHGFKYNGNVALTRFLAHEMHSVCMNDGNLRDYQLIVPVPLHWFKRMKRGYNQTELLAQELSKLLKIPSCDVLKRFKWTKSQASLDRKQRKKNLKNAFILKKNKDGEFKKSVLLLDDVFTTGSTLEECTKALLSAGVEKVYVITLAKGG